MISAQQYFYGLSRRFFVYLALIFGVIPLVFGVYASLNIYYLLSTRGRPTIFNPQEKLTPSPPPAPTPTDTLVVIGDPVLFEKNSIVLSGSANSIIDRQAKFLRDNPTITVTVVGYTSDNEGTRESPAVLAQLRANQVRHSLIERGVAKTRMDAVGYGRLRSANGDADEVAQAQNRRVVVMRN